MFVFLPLSQIFDGKRITETIDDKFDWLLVGDSHASYLGSDLARHGINCVSIRGGRIQHARNYLESHDYCREKMSALFLLLAGNNLDNEPPSGVATQMENLVYDIVTYNPTCVVITGTVVPRSSSLGGEDGFINRSEKFDSELSQWGENHHHFLSDLFVDDCDKTGRGKIRSDLFIGDKTHLNKQGRTLLLDQILFVVEAVNRGEFAGRKEWGYKHSSRATLWKF